MSVLGSGWALGFSFTLPRRVEGGNQANLGNFPEAWAYRQ